MNNNEKISRIHYLVEFLRKCANEYYNGSTPSLSDAQYDALFDELQLLEDETGVILADSPTQNVGSEILGSLPKVTHKIPLLSLAKTKDANDIAKMAADNTGYLALKIDGLTVELLYENGVLTEASTRGDGTIGELITHNARVFKNIPHKIPLKNTLRVTGEAYIYIDTFNQINEKIDNDEDKFSTPRNLAAGSVRQLDSSVCKERNVHFMPFNVLEGMESISSRSERIITLSKYGFSLIPFSIVSTGTSAEEIIKSIAELKSVAFKNNLPIDGIVFFYDDAIYSASLGRTAHHFRDGIAYKFGDPTFETTLKEIKWNISRTGQLTPIAIFDAIEIDNTIVERASLHNITFIKELKLKVDDRILVSKRNMIIPHIEKNLSNTDRDSYHIDAPVICPICKNKTEIVSTINGDRTIEVLYCNNPYCAGKKIKAFSHFVSKHAMNIDGLSEQTIEKFIERGWLQNLSDIYSLSKYRDAIIDLDGFGEKSYNKLISAIDMSKETTLSNLLVALNIDLIGKSGAKLIEDTFKGNVNEFKTAICNSFDFSSIDGFGEKMNSSIHDWFSIEENKSEFKNLLDILTFKVENYNIKEDSVFFNKRIVITGTFNDFSRDELTEKLTKLGAKVSGSVSSKTDFVLCGENAGSKLQKANDLGIKVLFENDFINDI